VEQARVSAEQASDALAEAAVRAPFAGEIVETFVEVGEFAAAGAPTFRIIDVVDREAVFDVGPEDAESLLASGTVTLRFAGRDVVARLVASARPAQQARLVQLTARLEGDDALGIPTGALAEVRYEVNLGEGELVPSGAVSSDGTTTFVLVAEEGVAVRRDVEVVAEAGARAVVTGLRDGDAVIHPRPLDVREGASVRTLP
jgi:multidrug efflux pump subunit AcrA (membrane-fusion protein)